MATINWPTTIPEQWIRQGYSFTPDKEPLRTEMEYGKQRARQMMTVRVGKITGVLRMTAEQYASIFVPFWQNTLARGTLPFNMGVVTTGQNLVVREVRFLAMYTPIFNPNSTWIEVQLEVINP